MSGVRQSKITKGPVLAGLGGKGLRCEIYYIIYIQKTSCNEIGSFSKHDSNLNGDVRRNKRIVRTKQRELIISSPNRLNQQCPRSVSNVTERIYTCS